MKLYEIMDQEPAPERVTGRLGDDELGVAYEKLRRSEMSKEEINQFAHEMVEQGRYPRSPESLKFVMSRMHIILHGIAPQGETQSRADVMFRDTKPIINYVLKRGELDQEDIDYHIGEARKELAERPPPKVKVKPEEARKMMSDFYRENKANLPPTITQAREQIIQDIMNGDTAEEAFAKHM